MLVMSGRFKKCKRCGKLTRESDPKCWNCKKADFEEERVEGSRGSTSMQSYAPTGLQGSVEEPIRCPRCGSTQVTANKKGFGVGKALVGGFLTGGVGLLAGFLGSGEVMVTCVKCGKQWKAGG
jgi:RNA polymerase subunit RPABC4/transcription elongation factor Spt4